MPAGGVGACPEAALVLAPARTALHGTSGTPEPVVDGVEVRMGRGPQYTGSACRTLCREWGVEQTLALGRRPTDWPCHHRTGRPTG
jgi:hypothetical protein